VNERHHVLRTYRTTDTSTENKGRLELARTRAKSILKTMNSGPVTVVFRNIKFMRSLFSRISWGFLGEGAANDSGVPLMENVDFQCNSDAASLEP